MSTVKVNRRSRIKKRIRKNISGTANKPRLSVFRSNKEIYAQIIDDVSGKTLASAASLHEDKAQKTNKVDQAKQVGKMIAESATKAGSRKLFLIVMDIYFMEELRLWLMLQEKRLNFNY